MPERATATATFVSRLHHLLSPPAERNLDARRKEIKLRGAGKWEPAHESCRIHYPIGFNEFIFRRTPRLRRRSKPDSGFESAVTRECGLPRLRPFVHDSSGEPSPPLRSWQSGPALCPVSFELIGRTPKRAFFLAKLIFNSPKPLSFSAKLLRLSTRPLRPSAKLLRLSARPLRVLVKLLRLSARPLRVSVRPLRVSIRPLRVLAKLLSVLA
jgi:hypothetical protein